ncbi:MAG: tetratricopeptide repeat protein [Helicobacter sp.]|nr:tetratricopeptide repeat protein [Helicobacter sp.]
MLKNIFALCLCFGLCFGAFDEEASLFQALDLQESGKLREARDLYLVLYDETKKREYLKESILLGSLFEQPKIVLSYIKDYQALTRNQWDMEISKVLLDVYMKTGDVSNALKTAKKIQAKEDSPEIHNILGVIYLTQGDKKKAISEFEWLYETLGTQESLQKLLILLEENNQYARAVELLDSYLAENPCESDFCQKALQFYAKGLQTQKIEALLKKRYENEPNIQNAQSLITLYTFRQKYKEALEIASLYPFDPQLLIGLYVGAKDYKNASKSAFEIYNNTKNSLYLCYGYLYQFETIQKTDVQQIKKLLNDMQQAVSLLEKDSVLNLQQREFAIFYNFLGYILIDYEFDIAKGIQYANKALQIEPNESAYLDSLAWGYYKQKQCAKAKEIFQKIPQDQRENDQDILKHSQALQSCD